MVLPFIDGAKIMIIFESCSFLNYLFFAKAKCFLKLSPKFTSFRLLVLLSVRSILGFCLRAANEMLISQDVFKKLLGVSRHDISLNELRAIQSNYGISVEAQMFKAKQLGIISESRYKYFCITKNKNQAFREQVEKSTFHEEKSNRFSSLVYRALASELISFSKASELLNESIYVVREQLELI